MTPGIVLDTNVYVSATLSGGKPYRVLHFVELGDADLYVSPFILGETEDVLGRDEIPFDDDRTDTFVDRIIGISTVVSPDEVPDVVEEDPSDDRILACTVEADADYLVSGDSHLLSLGEYDGIGIVDPSVFLREVERDP